MASAPQVDPPDSPQEDLSLLYGRYIALPPPFVRWQTRQGWDFMDDVLAATDLHGVKAVAGVLGISPQGVYYILSRRRPQSQHAWPAPDDLRDLSTAWRRARMDVARRRVRRSSAEYIGVHQALKRLMDRGFIVREIALAMGVPIRQLNRFLQPPLESPKALAQAVHEALARDEGADPARDNPDCQE